MHSFSTFNLVIDSSVIRNTTGEAISIWSNLISIWSLSNTENSSVKKMGNRGNYMKINQIDRDRIIDAYQNNQDYMTLAEQLGIKRQTTQNIVIKFRNTGARAPQQKGGHTYSKLTIPMINAMVGYIEAKPTVTLKEIREKLLMEFPQNEAICVQTISRCLDGELITLKKLKSTPIQWNTLEVKASRRDFVEWLVNEGMRQTLLFQDETGFNLFTSRTRGWAPRGVPAVRIIEGQRGPNVTVAMAVSPVYGLVHYAIFTGGMTSNRFQDFLTEIGELLPEDELQILIDNASAHNDAEEQVTHSHEIKRLPKYSPFINMCELANSALKADLKRRLTDPVNQQRIQNRNEAHAAGLTLQAHRLRILTELIEISINTITVEKCQQWFQHILTYTIRCLNQEDILV